MKKLLAILISISILTASNAPAFAQGGVPEGIQKAYQAGQEIGKAVEGAQGMQEALRAVQAAETLTTVPTVQIPGQDITGLTAAVENLTRQAVLGTNISAGEISQRALQDRTTYLPEAILQFPNAAQRAALLRGPFVTAAANGSATPQQIALAATFWRSDLMVKIDAFDHLTTADNPRALEALADTAALGMFGTQADIALLLDVLQHAKGTPLESAATAHVARGLLRLGAFDELEKLFAATAPDGTYSTLQNGIASYAQAHDLAVRLAQTKGTAQTPDLALRKILEPYGKVNATAADPTLVSTQQWMEWGYPVQATPAGTAPQPVQAMHMPVFTEDLPSISRIFTTPAPPLSAGPVGQIRTPASVHQPGALTTAEQAELQQAARQLSADLAEQAKKAPTKELAALFQRASLYAASFVMGLEIATPVIANFGTSFGLSLEDNILVTAATYLPYSLGSFLSNWLKEKIGRKTAVNLGLLLMVGGFLGGVLGCGLDGSFLPETDTLSHFYKALACITIASMGGVFIHTSVGPLMTELNANENELVRQQRSSYTEVARALGMTASFAFPWLATKVFNMDWSFTFTMALPMVAMALMGINLTKLPNTKPFAKAAVQTAANQTKGLWQTLKSNSYISLFKEEKGVGALLAGLFIMNAVEMSINNGFLFLLPGLTKDPSAQYLFGLAQFAAPFLFGRYLAGRLLKWFPKHNMSISTLASGLATAAAVMPGIVDNVYALTAALFAAETGISTTFTLSFARTAKNPSTQDRITSLIVATALSCAIGPMLFASLTQTLINAGIFAANGATAAAMIGVPAFLAILSAKLFKRVEDGGKTVKTVSALQKAINRLKKQLKR